MKNEEIKKINNYVWISIFLGLIALFSVLGTVIYTVSEMNSLRKEFEPALAVFGNLNDPDWALNLDCISWSEGYCEELVALNMSGGTVFQPRGIYNSDCRQYCIQESVRRIKIR